MDQDERRIRRLKLRSRDDSLLFQARYRLEEAFRTASLPGLPPNAQLLVRRLDLGSIRIDQTPVMLANRISALMRNLAATAVCVDYQPAAHANVVWFSDRLQPYKVLLVRLLDGKALPEWYWRTLFPNQALALNSVTIEMILSRAAFTPLKGLAAARLLQATLEPRRLARLFPCISAELARRLLHAQGLSPVAVVNPTPQAGGQVEPYRIDNMQTIAAPNMSLPWRHAMQQAMQCWGERDVRTLWFAWHALIIHQPAWLEHRDALQRIVPGVWLKSWARNQSSVDAASDAVVETERPRTQPPMAAALTTGIVSAADPTPELLAQEVSTCSPSPPMHLPVPKEGAVDPSFAAEPGPQKRNAGPAEDLLKRDGVEPHGADEPQRGVAPFSAHAGFAFVIPLLQRLGMTELLADNERLVVLDFPRQLLWSLARRFGLAESDPLQALFAGFEAGGDIAIEQFWAPDSWRRLMTPSCRLLTGMEERGQSIQLHELIKIVQLLGALYLRRYCRISLRSLIQRPGRVVMTVTHWDVIFDLNQIDLRLRRIALDSDPGWVPWLGRVVQFHYDSEGERYV